MADEKEGQEKKYTKEQLRRTPKIAEGDETPAGYLGYDGPRSASAHDEAKTATVDDQSHAKPLDPRMAGADAQAAGHPVESHDVKAPGHKFDVDAEGNRVESEGD